MWAPTGGVGFGPPGAEASVADGTHDAMDRENAMSRTPAPLLWDPVAFPLTKPPEESMASKYVGPGGPTGPVCPCNALRALVEISRRRIDRSLISDDLTALRLISAAPTEFVLSCAEPTLLRGRF